MRKLQNRTLESRRNAEVLKCWWFINNYNIAIFNGPQESTLIRHRVKPIGRLTIQILVCTWMLENLNTLW